MEYVSTVFCWSSVLTLLLLWPEVVQSQCKKVNDCKCKQPNGQVIDLSSIGNPDGNSPQFDYTTPQDQSWAVWEFSFNGCHKYSDQYCSGVVACQRSTDTTVTPGFALGTPDTADYTDGTRVRFGALGQDGQQRYTEVDLICDPNGSPGTASVTTLGEPNFDWVYKYEMTSKCCCPNGCGGGGGGGGGLSFGSVLCIIFTCLVVVYLVGGVLFMKYGRGAEGKEIIPNVNIWIQMPSLVKDGTMFVVSFVKSGGGSSSGKAGYDEL